MAIQNNFLTKAKKEVKEILLTKEGWISWIFANIITSLPWFLPLAYGFVFQDERGYIAAAAVYAFILAPFTPFWILNIIIAIWFRKLLLKNKHGILVKGEQHVKINS
jgi:hypothetical protein